MLQQILGQLCWCYLLLVTTIIMFLSYNPCFCSCPVWVQTVAPTVWRGERAGSGTAWTPAGSTNRTTTWSPTWVIAIRNPPTWWSITTSVEASSHTVARWISIAVRREVKSRTVASLILDHSLFCWLVTTNQNAIAAILISRQILTKYFTLG